MPYILAISCREPWASFILRGTKPIETRTHNTHIRGKILIHTTKIPDRKALRYYGLREDDFKNGYIIGSVLIIDSYKYKNKKHFEEEKNKHLSFYPFNKGVHGWKLIAPQKIEPVKYKGSQGFFKVKIR